MATPSIDDSNLPLVIINPKSGAHTHTIILLHGRDSTARDFASDFLESEASGPDNTDRTLPALFPTLKWAFPQAKMLRSERFDQELPQWFDMWKTEDPMERCAMNMPGLNASIGPLVDLIRREEEFVPRERIFFGGISQGFATVLATLFAEGRGGFAGLVGFNSWFPLGVKCELLHECKSPLERLQALQEFFSHPGRYDIVEGTLGILQTPILLQHSRDDQVIDISYGTLVRNMLREFEFSNVEWKEYEDGGHWVNEPEGIDELVVFLRNRMQSESGTAFSETAAQQDSSQATPLGS
ncbi:Alpha/Beta hydrolase protein [Immersiella caudata]|uniref:Alpha/Beta hydrolase protein n=1 Tax=Immersiella caudata TaxID=314043 RepID=A0AA39WQF3_9PEZI|nr:Alpha/Beta hydrolase protein [Immersiella caudata]